MVLISTITVLQVTALVFSASRQSPQVLNEMQREDDAHDLLRSRSDAPDEWNYFAALHDERD
jgi:hypothetical protein